MITVSIVVRFLQRIAYIKRHCDSDITLSLHYINESIRDSLKMFDSLSFVEMEPLIRSTS